MAGQPPNPESLPPSSESGQAPPPVGHPSDLPRTGPYFHPERDTSPEKALTLPEAAIVPLPVRPAAMTVGPYEIIEEIGRGGMGIVYKARHTQLGRVVALKTIRADL